MRAKWRMVRYEYEHGRVRIHILRMFPDGWRDSVYPGTDRNMLRIHGVLYFMDTCLSTAIALGPDDAQRGLEITLNVFYKQEEPDDQG